MTAPPATPPTATHCPYCSLQCGVAVTAGERPATLQPLEDFPTNRGGLCSKGWTAAELLDHPDRLLAPLVRGRPGDRSSPLRLASWDEALDAIVAGVERVQRTAGRDAVGVFGGGGLTNEKAYTLGKLAKVALRTSSCDYNGRWCMSSAAKAMVRAFGVDRGFPFPLSDVAEADAVLLVGGNPADTMPPAMQWFDEGRHRGAVHVVVDPRRTATARGATRHLRIAPGTDLALANGLLHLALRDGLVDEDYVAARTTGFDRVRAAVARAWPERVERLTGVSEQEMRAVVRTLAEAERAMVLTARGPEQQAHGTDTAQAWINLALALGLPGRPGSGYATVTGQGNGQGGREHGQKSDQLPGYRSVDDPAARAAVAAVWGVDPDGIPGAGPSAFELLAGAGTPGGVRALLVFGSNPVVSAPDRDAVTARLDALDLLVVADLFLSDTAARADVVLPTAQWAEEEGTLTSVEGRVIRRRRALPPPEGVRDELDVLADLAERLGAPVPFAREASAVFDELARASAGGPADYAGLSHARLDEGPGLFWPCPTADHPGTPRLFTERFPTPDGRARFVAVDLPDAVEPPDARYPYLLTTGRHLQQYQSGTQTRRVAALAATHGDPRAQLHPDLAARHGIADGDVVELATRRGRATFRAHLTRDIRPDTVFVPFHHGGRSAANALTDATLDPLSRMPSFKLCATALVRVGGPEELRVEEPSPVVAAASPARRDPTRRPRAPRDPRGALDR